MARTPVPKLPPSPPTPEKTLALTSHILQTRQLSFIKLLNIELVKWAIAITCLIKAIWPNMKSISDFSL